MPETCRWCRADEYRPCERGEVRCPRCGEREDAPSRTTVTTRPRVTFVPPTVPQLRTVDVPVWTFALADGYPPRYPARTRYLRIGAPTQEQALALAEQGWDRRVLAPDGRLVPLEHDGVCSVRFPVFDAAPRIWGERDAASVASEQGYA